ncbi:unnamed protein product [Lupinus luteus]|uniref:Uncharacterized protein n=1 Tax=Lupinus luteus TaxID=3873 RepID=A0AAV1XI87_LUPLU
MLFSLAVQILLASFLQVGTHSIIIEFSDPVYNTRRSATYLPEVAADEGNFCSPLSLVSLSHLGSEVGNQIAMSLIQTFHRYFVFNSARKLIGEEMRNCFYKEDEKDKLSFNLRKIQKRNRNIIGSEQPPIYICIFEMVTPSEQ